MNTNVLNTACTWAMKAYNKKNKDAVKIGGGWTGAAAYFAKRQNMDILAFRGTEKDINDIIADITAIPVPYAGRVCHAGFVIQHASVWKEILTHIDFNKPLLICGHSLGGALAEISAAKLDKKHSNVSLVTFGKPNTFLKGFKKPMELDNQISCVNGSDAVARVPRILYGPSSSQTLLYFGNSGEDHINPSVEVKKKDRGGLMDRLADHSMSCYRDRLKAFIKGQSKSNYEAVLTDEERRELEKIADEIEREADN
jgi:hypothetical protein